jgi:protein-S-isoprenylcysteine O-methyltransferase Ste14
MSFFEFPFSNFYFLLLLVVPGPMALLYRVLDVVAFIYLLAFFPTPFFWLIIHPAIGFWRKFGNGAYWVALPVWLGVGAILFLVRHPLYAHRLERTPAVWILGLALLALAVGLNRNVHQKFSVRRIIGLPEIHPERDRGSVVRTGIYGLVRHPRYLEFMVAFVALGLLTGAAGIFLLAIVSLLMYLIVAPLEERELRQHYGTAYDDYVREVPRFLPRLRQQTKAPNPS